MSIRARLHRIEQDTRAAVLERIRAAPSEELDRLLTETIIRRADAVGGTHAEHLHLFLQWLRHTKSQHPATIELARTVWHGPLDNGQLETFNRTEALR